MVWWMLAMGCADITPIEDGAVFGPVEVVQDWFTSTALVQTEDTTLLVDAGFREGAMRRSLRKRGVDPEEVDHVLLTHGHGDHVAALGLYPNAEVWALPEEASILEEQGVAETQALAEGQQVFGGIAVEVVAVPGHTPGSAVYVIEGVALLGDTAQITRDGRLTPVAEKYSEDPIEAEESLGTMAQALLELEVSVVLPSHSGSGDAQTLQAYIDGL
jgi:glyoxylase-like metal-dependent hydrolase (beta-lactamase superfamily II)